MSAKAARRTRFEQVYAKIADELVGTLRQENLPQEALDWFRKVR
jgi:farnesyl diphosphate synthase